MREKLIELVNNVLKCLPWGEVSSHTAGEVADHLIANGVTTQEWISVKDGLPNVFEGVLAYCPKDRNIYLLYLNARGEWHFWMKLSPIGCHYQNCRRGNDYDICSCTKTNAKDQRRPHPGYER